MTSTGNSWKLTKSVFKRYWKRTVPYRPVLLKYQGGSFCECSVAYMYSMWESVGGVEQHLKGEVFGAPFQTTKETPGLHPITLAIWPVWLLLKNLYNFVWQDNYRTNESIMEKGINIFKTKLTWNAMYMYSVYDVLNLSTYTK